MADTPLPAVDLPGWFDQPPQRTIRLLRQAAALSVRLGGGLERWRGVLPLLRDPSRTDVGSLGRHLVAHEVTGRMTGYYQPLIEGRRVRDATFRYPLYRRPPQPELRRLARRDIDAGALAGRGYELVWLADPVDAYFIHIQGSAAIRLDGGRVLGIGVAATNERPYLAIGRPLVARGHIDASRLTAATIKTWLRRHPADGAALMAENARFVFFAERPGRSPVGAAGEPLRPFASIATDPDRTPFGAPVWLADGAPDWLDWHQRRLLLAHDIGGAIRGRGRFDLFCGTGKAAWDMAHRLNATVRCYTMQPGE